MTMNSAGVAPSATTTTCGAPSAAVALFRSLGEPARLAILMRLAEGEARVVDLVRALGLAQSTISAHLACLRDCGLVDSRAEGRSSFYFLARPELLDLLASAEDLLAATGEAVDLCPTYGRTPAATQRKEDDHG
ncbi:metalloregulator ArsR/SmtB family transcription factor [Streptomyces sp. P9(2023)]|uniref:ArsR/SmtB family transcription factor n=1 Tax=Streptomyces sp. P9(2023) TaxID=3064394 RepID=UPI0028F44FD4|nr:metalloregulator ArsR/SmtB family transcription factor [Streptomyces sp. P9(2023)]MDT9692967.1 metalloregulator ArsR/SmtB family transcription factor [Streptomyces sp. P9(2023)]